MNTSDNPLDISSRASACAEMILETTPLLMQGLRGMFREVHPEKLSVPQFRTLLFVRAHAGCPLNDLADHLDIRKSAASGIMGRLEEYGMAKVEPGVADKRCVALRLTQEGAQIVEAFQNSVRTRLGIRMESLSSRDLEVLTEAFSLLKEFFGPDRD